MAIEIRQPGTSELFAKAGAMIGSAERKKQEAAAAQRRSDMILGIRAEQQAKERAYQLELEKMEMTARLNLQAEMAAQAWEIEKAQIRSRTDFEKEERSRMQKIDEYEASIKAIDNADILSDKQKAEMKFNTTMKHRMGSQAPQYDPMQEMMDLNKYEIAQQRAAMAEEAHQRRMNPPTSFADRRAAFKIEQELSEKVEGHKQWYNLWSPGKLTPAEQEMRSMAQNILQNRTIQSAPAPRSVDEFESTVIELGKTDPVKAQQYYEQFKVMFGQR